MPLGQNKNNFNYNLDEKRVLNFENVVDDSDNVKQDMSIDVYGRQTDEEKAEAKPDTKSDDKVHITKTRQVASCTLPPSSANNKMCCSTHVTAKQGASQDLTVSCD